MRPNNHNAWSLENVLNTADTVYDALRAERGEAVRVAGLAVVDIALQRAHVALVVVNRVVLRDHLGSGSPLRMA